ncbi:ChaC-like protein [Melanomma pulvis-pyrius CBS 109.77]|uniref:glutathione-specific gamma-glutamylcyclotransferase n=1 Tax=Melanomma pulvis-pyrius CBS 109.77 TaxID=1314802 RepID=A0A6A6XN35_9PLEO|nr:ChaC-like protein [Melanomma pulvis-pyrius CBS 109.77]
MTDHEKQIEDFGKNNDFWLFGYGSLIWKPPPHYDQRVPGFIKGYVRRFWQHANSEDHRGTPEAPGRVVTLIDRAHWDTLTDHHESPERVWGAAYHIPSPHVAEVREYLDIREINGYSIQFTPFHPAAALSLSSAPTSASASSQTQALPQQQQINCLVYIGLPSNPQFLGPQDPQELAAHILRSRGPSGENREYLYLLEEGLLGLSGESGDAHVSDLVTRAREIEDAGREGVGSTEEQEEVEK